MNLSKTHSLVGNSTDLWINKGFGWMLFCGILVNLLGLTNTIMEPDGALYASIAKTIALSGDFVNLKVGGQDWLDKPHFPFWMAAISFKIFGINGFAYKLPALFFWLMGGYYLYRFGKTIYNNTTAKIALLIYVTAAHLVISNNDVRAEPYLTGLTIGSIFHYYHYSKSGKITDLILGSLFAACALMTKGPFILITIASGFVLEWMITKQWKQLFSWKWILAILLVAIFTLPELYCLYLQFDTHPEKIVFGKTNVSGIRFFLYDSQFGRFFNTGPIKGKGDPSFYLHTLLWAFIPWSLILYTALFQEIKSFRKTAETSGRLVILGASLTTFVLFSASRFQLPHYINILFPFFCIISAHYLMQIRQPKTTRVWFIIQSVLSALLGLAIVLLSILFEADGYWLMITFAIAGIVAIFYFFRRASVHNIISRSFFTGILVYIFLNGFFYPALLKYQSGSEMAFYLNKNQSAKPVVTYNETSFSLDFYTKQPVTIFNSIDDLKTSIEKERPVLVTSINRVDTLRNAGINLNILQTFPHFRISKINGKFLRKSSREKTLDSIVVAEAFIP